MRLNEIDYLRPLLFIQLFFVHAFTIYTVTSWAVPAGIGKVEVYDWIARVSNSCMLELFTFISGYVFSFVSTRKKSNNRDLVVSKFRRLMIPSLLFSILYYILLMNHKEFGLLLIYEIICGEGHLWYLPMLFGCFVIAHFTKDANKPFVLLIVAFVVSAFSRCPNIFRISQIAYYFFYFYVGLFVYKYRELIINYVSLRNNPKKIIMGGGIFVLSIIVLLPLNVYLKSLNLDTWIKGYFLAALIRAINIVYSSIGIAFWYYVSILLSRKSTKVPSMVIHFNVLSMGVYVFHQFVLMYLYYHTSLPTICGSYLLPWVAILITFPTSIILSHFFRLNRIGKYIL